MNIKSKPAIVAILASILFPLATLADLPNPLRYNLVVTHTVQCLTDPGWGLYTVTTGQQQNCTSVNNQKIRISHNGNSNQYFYSLENPITRTLAADQGTGNTVPARFGSWGSNVALDARRWKLDSSSPGQWKFVNVQSNRCLDIAGWNSGAISQIYDCNGGGAQAFYIEPDGGHFKIKAVHSGKCLEIENGSQSNHAWIVQKTCNGSWLQEWKVLNGPNGKMLVNRLTGRLADLDQGNTTNGTKIQQYQFAQSANQNWDVNSFSMPRLPNNQQTYRIIVPGANKCADIEGASQGDNAKLKIWDCLGAGQTNQLFTFEQ